MNNYLKGNAYLYINGIEVVSDNSGLTFTINTILKVDIEKELDVQGNKALIDFIDFLVARLLRQYFDEELFDSIQSSFQNTLVNDGNYMQFGVNLKSIDKLVEIIQGLEVEPYVDKENFAIVYTYNKCEQYLTYNQFLESILPKDKSQNVLAIKNYLDDINNRIQAIKVFEELTKDK